MVDGSVPSGTSYAVVLVQMGGTSQSVPTLRLVNTVAGEAVAPSPRRGTDGAPRLRIAAENHAASSLGATDARWVLAVQVMRSLEGGKAALLRPEKRRSLLIAARTLGLRDFDANLVIAIVQDGVRSGEGGLSRNVEDRLALIKPASPVSEFPAGLLLGVAIVLGVAAFGVLTRLVGG